MPSEPTRAPRELFDLTGQVVLVTGSSHGIGRAIAWRFAQAGARVAVHYHRRAAEAQALVAEVEAAGGEAAAFSADLTDRGAVDNLVQAVTGRLGRLDVLVNNAGVYPVSPLLETSAAEWEQVLAANLNSVHYCTQAAGAVMAAQAGGCIINIASVEALVPAPGHAHYCAAKAAVVMHTRSAAIELGPRGVRVNAVSPGLIWRPGIEQQIPDFVAAWSAGNPLGRLGQPEEVADACLFLASPAARWITGINLPVDGGYLARTAAL